MAKLILASVLCIFLLVKGTEAQAPGEDCGTADACDPGATCETPKCKADVGESCANNLPCLAAAACDPEDSKCKTKVDEGDTCTPATDNKICDPAATATLTCDTDCKVIAGEVCTKDTTVCIDNADCTASECTCTGEFTASVDSTQCVANVPAGQSCLDGKTCETTATCETIDSTNKTCMANLGKTCSAGTINCVTGATCEGSTCKKSAGTSGCTDSGTTLCVSTATCESSTCVANLGQTCSDTINCVTGATCEGTTCKKNAGTSGCTDSGTTLCVSTATCQNTKCVANLGESCEGSINCVTDTDCDTTDSTCRTKVTKAGSACSEKTTFCDPTTLTCDGENCKIQVDQSCAATTECTAYAECDTTCKCKAPDYTAASGVCVGTKTLGEECANDNCAPGFVCDGGKCKTKLEEAGDDCSATDKACDPTTLACQDGKCKWQIEQGCTATDQCVAGATCEGSGTTNKQCSCPVGVSPSSDKAQCGGAMGIAASMLLVVATFVTSRFL